MAGLGTCKGYGQSVLFDCKRNRKGQKMEKKFRFTRYNQVLGVYQTWAFETEKEAIEFKVCKESEIAEKMKNIPTMKAYFEGAK